MSHYALFRVKIRNPNVQLFRQAVNATLQKHKARNVTISQIGEKGLKCTFNILGCFRPFDIILTNDGEVSIRADVMYREAINNIQQLLVQNYAALALKHTLMQLGYQTQTQEVKEKIYLHAVRGW